MTRNFKIFKKIFFKFGQRLLFLSKVLYYIYAMKTFAAKLITSIIVVVLALCVGATALSLFISASKTANADASKQVVKIPVSNLLENQYAPASAFSLTEGDKTFYIPESYYLEVLSSNPTPDGSWIVYRINYQGYDFTLFSQDDLHPQTVSFQDESDMFPNITLTLSKDCEIDGHTFLSGSALTFLGYSDSPDQIFCVSVYNGDPYFDNIPLTSVEAFTVHYQKQDEQARKLLIEQQTKPDSPAVDGNITPNASLALRIVLIIGICVPAILIMIFLFVHPKQPKRYSRKPDNAPDYDDPRR